MAGLISSVGGLTESLVSLIISASLKLYIAINFWFLVIFFFKLIGEVI
jgi:hypothetical protein